MSDNLADLAVKSLGEKISEFKNALQFSTWQFKVVKPGTDNPSDDGWEKIELGFSWSPLDGEGWFRWNPHLPAEIAGIPLLGSQVNFEFFLTIGAGIYVNGKEMFREPSWSDSLAVKLTIFEHYQPDSPLSLEIRCNAMDVLGSFQSANLKFSKITEVVFDLDLVSAQILYCQFLASQEKPGSKPEGQVLDEAVKILDLAALNANDWKRWQASVAAFREKLSPFLTEAKTYFTHLIAHSHIDMNWLWPMKETIRVIQRDFKAMTGLMDQYEEFHFSHSQAATYRLAEFNDPLLFERMRQRVVDGHWETTAATWVEGDLNLSAGETEVRQILHARRYADHHFGLMPVVCWEPDTFGHNANFPQLLKKSGIKYYYFCRTGKGHPLFWWEGLDGSRVLAVQDLHFYSGRLTPSAVVEAIINFAGRYGTQRGLFVYGVGDHGGGATAGDIQSARKIDADPLMPRTMTSAVLPFFEQSQQEAHDLPVVKGELNTAFEGCYTSHSDIKRLNRECENLLLSTESVLAVASLLPTVPDDLRRMQINLTEAWRTLCFHQFHDILGGCAIGVTYREAQERLEQVLETARELSDRALQWMAKEVDTSLSASGNAPVMDVPAAAGTDVPAGVGIIRILVFNPLAWERDALVRVPLEKLAGITPGAVADHNGRYLPVQICDGELIFIAENLPGMGMEIYRLAPEMAAGEEGNVICDPASLIMNNGLIQLQVNPHSGELERLYDLQTGRTVHSDGDETWLNQLQILWEQPHGMSAWEIGKISHMDILPPDAQTTWIETGPVRGVVEVRRNLLNSTLVQRIVVYRKLRRIDFETTVDWHEHSNAHVDAPMLRVTFSPQLEQARASFEIPFAGLERPADGREVPALRWSDVSEESGNYGVSLLNNCKYGHQVDGKILGLTLIRTSYEPDVNPSEGLHTFTYSLYPHPKGWQAGGTLQQAAELNQPVEVTVTNAHGGGMQAENCWLECTSDSVLVSAFKLAEDQPAEGRAYIVRLFESAGKAGQASLKFGFQVKKVEETDLMELRIAEIDLAHNVVQLNFLHHEVKTLKVIA